MKTQIEQNGRQYEIEVAVEQWGPKEALEFLQLMPDHQREPKRWSVTRITQSMKNGQFMFNGDTFVFDQFGQAINGQHRALAIIESGITIPVIVVYGVPGDSYMTIDGDSVGKSSADYFKYIGIPNANSAASSAFLLHRYNHRDKKGQMRHSSLVTRGEILESYEANSEKIQFYCTKFAPVGKFIGSRAVLTAACVVIDNAYGGELTSCRAINTFHKTISADNKRPRKMLPPDNRFMSLLEAARILKSESEKVLIKPAIQKAPTL
jgi:hypothetical protein